MQRLLLLLPPSCVVPHTRDSCRENGPPTLPRFIAPGTQAEKAGLASGQWGLKHEDIRYIQG